MQNEHLSFSISFSLSLTHLTGMMGAKQTHIQTQTRNEKQYNEHAKRKTTQIQMRERRSDVEKTVSLTNASLFSA